MNQEQVRKDITQAAAEAINGRDIEQIDIDYILYDVMIIKAESLKDSKIFSYADYLEKQLLKIKRREAVLDI